MAEQVELELKIKGGDKAVKTLGALEKQLEKAREKIKGVEVGSKAFEKLAGEIQKASSEVKTLEKQMEGLEPQQKAEAFLKMGEAVAGGFAVMQGSMALMGVESENIEKAQVKVQSAIAIAMGVRMIAEGALMAATAKRVLVEKTTLVSAKLMSGATAVWTFIQGGLATSITATSIALGVLRAAIIATGVGALVVGVGALVSGISSWIGGSDDAAKAQKELAKEADILTQSIKNQLIQQQKQLDLARQLELEEDDRKDKLILLNAEIERQDAILKKYNEDMSKQVGRLKELGDSTVGLERHVKKMQDAYLESIETLKDQRDAQQDLIDIEDKAADKRKKRREERKKQREEDANNLLSLEKELSLMRIEDDNVRQAAKIEQDRQRALEAAVGQKEQIALINEKYDILEAEREDAYWENKIEKNNAYNQKISDDTIAIKAKEAEAQKATDDKVANSKEQMVSKGFAAAKVLGGKNKKIQKGLAVAETIYNTQQAIMNAMATIPAPYNIPIAISTGIMGAGAIKNILSENMGSVSAGGDTTPEPMIPATTGAFTLGGVEEQSMKAYVITDEMSDSQAQLADIRRRSTI